MKETGLTGYPKKKCPKKKCPKKKCPKKKCPKKKCPKKKCQRKRKRPRTPGYPRTMKTKGGLVQSLKKLQHHQVPRKKATNIEVRSLMDQQKFQIQPSQKL